MINTHRVKIYVTWPWSADRRSGCPVMINLHTRKIYFEWRPFSGFVQGGDVRGRTDFSNYRKVRSWILQDQDPTVWEHLERR